MGLQRGARRSNDDDLSRVLGGSSGSHEHLMQSQWRFRDLRGVPGISWPFKAVTVGPRGSHGAPVNLSGAPGRFQ